MNAIRDAADFFLTEVLGMQWLADLIAAALGGLGLDVSRGAGAMLHFFLWDTLKIMALLSALIFVIAWIQSHFPPERARRILGGCRGIGANVAAALLGTVTPFCSCSSIPLFIGFTGAGLPLGVTFSFLISSPMVDLASLVLLTCIFGWKAALAYVVLGLVIAVAGGALIERTARPDWVEEFIRAAPAADLPCGELSARDRALLALAEVRSVARRTFPYVLAGVGIGAVIHNAIPASVVEEALGGGNPLAVETAVLAGVPMYADIFGTVPVAEALLAKGAGLGVVLAFMMAVTTLSLPSLIMLRKAVRPPLLALFVAVCTAGMILAGHIFNALETFLL
ncbi:permease [Sutterella sp.]|uniref:permease n=1 Tax=Sutterella sp. TaxID=1981025 RepID=UPI0026E04976|nr:permease [Sutterella sp.]MDO5532202.1 permease [Sutterella sp.]